MKSKKFIKAIAKEIFLSNVAFSNKLDKDECRELAADIFEWLQKMSEPIEGMMGDEEDDGRAVRIK